ncbi:MAG: L,D-transpeptidase [Methylocystis sp.]|jgi:lipoprotein-anchoring transpeptidase ErfK/SrfK
MRRLAFALICAFGALGALASPAFARSPTPPQPAQEYDPLSALFGGGSFAPQTSGDGRPQAVAIPREVVSFDGKYGAGTVIIATNERRLYYTLGNGQAIRYGVGVGRPGFEWAGTRYISSKREWPDWTPPSQMLRRRPDLPRHMEGGLNNPLGARAMYLSGTLYRIHGSNEPWTIGQAVSSGCIRMTNDDVVDLYNRVKVGTRVVVTR